MSPASRPGRHACLLDGRDGAATMALMVLALAGAAGGKFAPDRPAAGIGSAPDRSASAHGRVLHAKHHSDALPSRLRILGAESVREPRVPA